MPWPQHPAARRAVFTCAAALLFSALRPTPPLAARASAHKPPCKEINKAVWAGRTLEQIMADFEVDEQQVMKCTQKKGKRRKEKAAKKPNTSKHSGAASAHHSNGTVAGAAQQ